MREMDLCGQWAFDLEQHTEGMPSEYTENMQIFTELDRKSICIKVAQHGLGNNSYDHKKMSLPSELIRVEAVSLDGSHRVATRCRESTSLLCAKR